MGIPSSPTRAESRARPVQSASTTSRQTRAIDWGGLHGHRPSAIYIIVGHGMWQSGIGIEISEIPPGQNDKIALLLTQARFEAFFGPRYRNGHNDRAGGLCFHREVRWQRWRL